VVKDSDDNNDDDDDDLSTFARGWEEEEEEEVNDKLEDSNARDRDKANRKEEAKTIKVYKKHYHAKTRNNLLKIEYEGAARETR
jgi:hypothetical protein